MSKLYFHVLLAAVAVLLCACATSGPISAPVIGGVAAALSVVDQLLAAGVIDAAQHAALTGGFQSVAELGAAVDAVKVGVEQAKANGLSPEATGGIAAGAGATVIALLKAWSKFSNVRKAAKAA